MAASIMNSPPVASRDDCLAASGVGRRLPVLPERLEAEEALTATAAAAAELMCAIAEAASTARGLLEPLTKACGLPERAVAMLWVVVVYLMQLAMAEPAPVAARQPAGVRGRRQADSPMTGSTTETHQNQQKHMGACRVTCQGDRSLQSWRKCLSIYLRHISTLFGLRSVWHRAGDPITERFDG